MSKRSMMFKKFWHLNIANTFPNSFVTFFYSFDTSYGKFPFPETFLHSFSQRTACRRCVSEPWTVHAFT